MEKENIEHLIQEAYKLAKIEVTDEVWKEVREREERRIKFNEKAKQLYDDISYKTVEKYIKKALPLRVRLFNKVEVIGKCLMYDNVITYTYRFNNSNNYFKFEPLIYDMMEWK